MISGALIRVGPCAVEPLIDVLKVGPCKFLASSILGEIGDSRAAEPLAEAVKRGYPDNTLKALVKLGPAAVGPLVRLLDELVNDPPTKYEERKKYEKKRHETISALSEVNELKAYSRVFRILQQIYRHERDTHDKYIEASQMNDDTYRSATFRWNTAQDELDLLIEIIIEGLLKTRRIDDFAFRLCSRD